MVNRRMSKGWCGQRGSGEYASWLVYTALSMSSGITACTGPKVSPGVAGWPGDVAGQPHERPVPVGGRGRANVEPPAVGVEPRPPATVMVTRSLEPEGCGVGIVAELGDHGACQGVDGGLDGGVLGPLLDRHEAPS